MCGAKRHGGFTIFEVLIVIGIGSLLLALTLPIGFRFYQIQVSDETGESVLSALRNAESFARLGRHDTSYGVKYFPDYYVLFEGDTYASRAVSADQVFTLPPGATLASTNSEVVFAEASGRPNATGTVTVGMYGRSRVFAVTDGGVISELY